MITATEAPVVTIAPGRVRGFWRGTPGTPGASGLAALVAMGVAGPPDWRVALDWLRRSAEAGWQIAQHQLLALCDDRAVD